jgi:hypothetical protein
VAEDKAALSNEPFSRVCVRTNMKDMDQAMAGDGDGCNYCNGDESSDETSNNDANSNRFEGGDGTLRGEKDKDELYVEDDDLMGGSDDNDGKERNKEEKGDNKKEEDEDEKDDDEEEDDDNKEDEEDDDEEGENKGEKLLTKKDYMVPGRPDTLCKFKLFATISF